MTIRRTMGHLAAGVIAVAGLGIAAAPGAAAAPEPENAKSVQPRAVKDPIGRGLDCQPLSYDHWTWWRHCTTLPGYVARSVTHCDDGRVLWGPWVGPSSFVWSQSCYPAGWWRIDFEPRPA